jgi:hypothetical protein
MIINWTKERILTVPVVSGDANSPAQTGTIILVPGCNEVNTESWTQVRNSVKDKLKDKTIIEEHVTEKEGKIVAKEFKALSAAQASEIVEKTYNLKTLTSWKNKESRESVRISIMNQINKVENYKPKKKKD